MQLLWQPEVKVTYQRPEVLRLKDLKLYINDKPYVIKTSYID